MSYSIVVIIAVIWLVINLVNVVMKSWRPYEFQHSLQTIGLTVRPVQIMFQTQSMNRLFFVLSNCRPKLINKWYAIGSLVTLMAIVPSIYLLMQTLYTLLLANYFNGNRVVAKSQALYPVIPGVNLPMSDFVYYFLSLAISCIYHEAGHAVAALREGVRMHSFGLFMFIIIPGAFVNLSTEQVLNLNVWNQLKIFTAGVWNNITLAAMAIGLLVINPYVLSPLYTQPNNGVVVAYIEPMSGAAGPNGLRRADLITGVDDCHILDITYWKQCLLSIANNPRDGYCIDEEFIKKESLTYSGSGKSAAPVATNGQRNGGGGSHHHHQQQCCDINSENSLCFYTRDDNNYSSALDSTIGGSRRFICLPVRQLLDTSPTTCNTSADCLRGGNSLDTSRQQESLSHHNHQQQQQPVVNNNNYYHHQCVRPVGDYNSTKLIRIRRQGRPNVLFWGSPSELYQSIILVKYKPKLTTLPLLVIHYYETLLRYIISFSLALAVFNVVPCIYLDGQWILNAFIELILANRVNQYTKRLVSNVIISFGTLLLSSCVIIGLYQLLDT